MACFWWFVMVISAVAAQQHNDTRDYLQRILNDSGSVARNVQIELNEFVKWHYTNGLRDNTGVNHGVRYCSLFITNALAGYLQCLWHVTTQKTNTLVGNTPTYALTTGISLDSDVSYLNTNFNTNNLPNPINNVAIGLWLTTYVTATDSFSNTQSASNRITMHSPWTDNTIYFDAGNESTSRINYTIPVGSRTKAFYVGTKESTTQQIIINGNSVLSQTRSLVTLTSFSNFSFPLNNSPNTPARQTGGFFVSAKAIPSSLFSAHYTVWQRLQQSVSSSR